MRISKEKREKLCDLIRKQLILSGYIELYGEETLNETIDNVVGMILKILGLTVKA